MECYDEIAGVVEKHRTKWTFKATVIRDFDDVKSEIMTHIWKKWELYDQAKPLGGWVATITKHQFHNILRNIYLSTSSPCVQCPCNRGKDDNGDGLCSMFTFQCNDCPLFAKWAKTKQSAHNARLPVSLEYHADEIANKPDEQSDLEPAIMGMHEKMKAELTDSEWQIYKRLYILNMSPEKIAKDLDLKSLEKGRKNGYKRIRQVELIALKASKRILAANGIEGLK